MEFKEHTYEAIYEADDWIESDEILNFLKTVYSTVPALDLREALRKLKSENFIEKKSDTLEYRVHK